MMQIVAYWKGFGETSWLPEKSVEGLSTANQYLYAYFWATNQLTNKGGGTLGLPQLVRLFLTCMCAGIKRPVSIFEMGFELFVAFTSLFGIGASLALHPCTSIASIYFCCIFVPFNCAPAHSRGPDIGLHLVSVFDVCSNHHRSHFANHCATGRQSRPLPLQDVRSEPLCAQS